MNIFHSRKSIPELEFERDHPFEKRKEEAQRVREKYPDRIPCIVEIHHSSHRTLPELDRKKYLVPSDVSLAVFMQVLRKRMRLKPEKALFAFFGGNLVPNTRTLGQIYQEHRDPTGFLHMIISEENAFGY